MIEPFEYINVLVSNNYKLSSGVPCSNISSVFHELENSDCLQYVRATSESEAIGIATGSWLSGKKSNIICQNSGVGNIVNPLASLNVPYSIPITLFISMRGAPGFSDERQHDIMGRETKNILNLLFIKTVFLPNNSKKFALSLSQVNDELLNRKSCAFLINPNIISNPKVTPNIQVKKIDNTCFPIRYETQGKQITRQEAIEILMHTLGKYATIATTGYTCRELHKTGDRSNYFYMVGSMGLASAIGLGVSINTLQPTVVLDGDGALLMKMGICTTIGKMAPNNLVHILIDNGIYESTGCQPSNAESVDFSKIAQACGYKQIWQCTGSEAVERFSQALKPLSGPTFAHVRVSPSASSPLSRPKIELPKLAIRFRQFIIDNLPNESCY